jgi:tetratricopeptide (TPR) repeat protein
MTLLLLLALHCVVSEHQPGLAKPVTPREARNADSRGLSKTERDSSTPLRYARNDKGCVVALGDSLLRHGYYHAAALEFRRALYAAGPDSPEPGMTRLKLGLSLGAAGDMPAAASELRAAGRIAPELTEPAQLALAGFYAGSRRYDLAQFEVSDLLVFAPDSSRKASLRSATGWLGLQLGDLSGAAADYAEAGASAAAHAIRESRAETDRSPTLAAILSSFVPGSGEVYAGRPANGLLAFAVTAGSLVWAWSAAKGDDWVGASVIVSTFFWRYYNGSRANAIAFADEFNAASRRRRIAALSGRLPEPDWFGGTDSLLGYRLGPDPAPVDSVSGFE